MSRFEFGGFDIPRIADDGLEFLPDDLGNVRPLTYDLPDGTIFLPADYLAFGYTHYEVICIGAAGGRGGRGGPVGRWPYTSEQDPARPTGWLRAVWGAPILAPTESYGGAGGGGGLHVVSGRLDELPPEVLVTVGQVGDNAPVGYIGSKPTPYTPVRADSPAYGNDRTDFGDAVYVPPVAGEDGGHSSFGEVAQASGGKGGGPVKTTPGYIVKNDPASRYVPDRGTPGGDGGDGGVGGSIEAGGGGPGMLTILTPDPNGAYFEYTGIRTEDSGIGKWDDSTGIGEGGGGGRGGTQAGASFSPTSGG